MKLNQPARDLIGEGAIATIVKVNPSGTPNINVVWVARLDATRRRHPECAPGAVEAMTEANVAAIQSNSCTCKQAS